MMPVCFLLVCVFFIMPRPTYFILNFAKTTRLSTSSAQLTISRTSFGNFMDKSHFLVCKVGLFLVVFQSFMFLVTGSLTEIF